MQWQVFSDNSYNVECPTTLLILQWHYMREVLAAGVQLILGLNGVIWVSAESKQAPEQANSSLAEAQPNFVRNVSKAERRAIARVANCIRALAKLYFSIHPASILSVYTVCTTFHSPCLQVNMQMLCLETTPSTGCSAFQHLCLLVVPVM